nr:hypothetical protein OG461_00190 [Streptomyces sp. NBC_00995]WSW71221.1 hypothetical protein OG461_36345 [Streptomyces sp. NBC_00995]
MEALPASLILLGLTTDGQPVCVDLDAEGPHVLVCTGGRATGAPSGHVNMLGRYFFQLPDLPGGLRPLGGKNAVDGE